MKLRVVVDTNIWIRILLKGRVTLPILEAFNADKFALSSSYDIVLFGWIWELSLLIVVIRKICLYWQQRSVADRMPLALFEAWKVCTSPSQARRLIDLTP